MTNEEIIAQLTPIFHDIMDNDEIVLTTGTNAEEIEEWDSLTHIQLIVAIERHFKIRFQSNEIAGFKNVGEMCASINEKLAKA